MHSKLYLALAVLMGIVPLMIQSGIQAKESPVDIREQAAVKTKIIQYMKSRIALHQKMHNADLIRTDIEKGIQRNRALIMSSHDPRAGQISLTKFDEMTGDLMRQLREIEDPDTIVAMEQAELDQLISSENYIFGATREVQAHVEDYGPVMFLVTLPFDIATLPFTILFTALTGGDPEQRARDEAAEQERKNKAAERAEEARQRAEQQKHKVSSD